MIPFRSAKLIANLSLHREFPWVKAVLASSHEEPFLRNAKPPAETLPPQGSVPPFGGSRAGEAPRTIAGDHNRGRSSVCDYNHAPLSSVIPSEALRLARSITMRKRGTCFRLSSVLARTWNLTKNEKVGEPPSARPLLLCQKPYCCAEAARSFFITLTSTRPPLAGFVIVPWAPGAGALPIPTT